MSCIIFAFILQSAKSCYAFYVNAILLTSKQIQIKKECNLSYSFSGKNLPGICIASLRMLFVPDFWASENGSSIADRLTSGRGTRVQWHFSTGGIGATKMTLFAHTVLCNSRQQRQHTRNAVIILHRSRYLGHCQLIIQRGRAATFEFKI